MSTSITATVAANRFGLGARPGEIAAIGSDPRAALRAQIAAGPPRLEAGNLQPTSEILAEAESVREQIRTARASRSAVSFRANGAKGADGTEAADTGVIAGAALKLSQLYRPIYVAEVTTRLRHVTVTDQPFLERLTQFWSNHFAVSIDKSALLGLAGSFEREAIRPQVLGRFEDLLLAVERHPAMLLYLDNARSVGPESRAAQRLLQRRPDQVLGLNENLAREILELHTLGVDGGYTQTDVTTFAKILTGWSIGTASGIRPAGNPGEFTFRAELHEPGSQTLLGRRYPDDGEDQGRAALRDLARSPATARHLATKLVRHFVADDPPPAAVERLTSAWMRSSGDLPTVYRALIDSPEAWANPLAKFRTPADYVHATFRALALPVDDKPRVLAGYELLGQRTFAPGSPAGWPDRSADWDGASAVLKRVEWADALGQRLGAERDAAALAGDLLGATLSPATRTAVARAASGPQALTLLLASPEFMRR